MITFAFVFSACNNVQSDDERNQQHDDYEYLLADYKLVSLNLDTNILSNNEKHLIPIFKEIGNKIDELFWFQSYGIRDSLPKQKDSILNQLLQINFGPWSRFKNNAPFIDGIGNKPLGANFYPADMEKSEFMGFEDSSKTSPFNFIRRNDGGNLIAIPYSKARPQEMAQISELFKKAATICLDPAYKKYLNLKSQAFITDEYEISDAAWLETQNNHLDFIAGPIEIFDDRLLGFKAEFESFLFIKDTVQTREYAKYVLMLPYLQKALPVSEMYRHEDPEYISGLSVANILDCGGAAKAGGYSISVTYPSAFNKTASKKRVIIQFKNIIDAKYQNILLPIAKLIIDPEQQNLLSKEAFFQNNLFSELGIRLGIKEVLNTGEPVRSTLKEYATLMDLVKAYAMSLYIAEKLYSAGEIKDLNSNYIVFLSEIFRTLRFGKSSSFSQSKVIIFNYLMSENAIQRNLHGYYKINQDKIKASIEKLINEVLVLQGNGDYKNVEKFVAKYNIIDKNLQKGLDKLANNQLFTDIILKQ